MKPLQTDQHQMKITKLSAYLWSDTNSFGEFLLITVYQKKKKSKMTHQLFCYHMGNSQLETTRNTKDNVKLSISKTADTLKLILLQILFWIDPQPLSANQTQ